MMTEETFEEFEARMKSEEGASGGTNTTPALEANDEDEAEQEPGEDDAGVENHDADLDE